ncbi:MAG: DUF4233 domain-containing protein [Micromonosporaceae bacterium]
MTDQQGSPDPAGNDPAESTSADAPAEEIRSGLRNPRGAVRVLGILALAVEAITLLLAVRPLQVLGAGTAAVVAVLVLAGFAVLLACLLRYQVTWYLVGALNIAVTLCGFFQWAIGVIGVVFALVWWWVLHVRRTIIGSSVAGPG